MEDATVEFLPSEKFSKVDEIPIITPAIERLVEGGQSLLTVEHEFRRVSAVKLRSAGERSRLEGTSGLLLEEEQASCWIGERDRHKEILDRGAIPHKVALEVRDSELPCLNLREKEVKFNWVGIECRHALPPDSESSGSI
jgi:hypothetical protein